MKDDELIEDLAVRRHLPGSHNRTVVHEGRHIVTSEEDDASTNGAINHALLYPTDVSMSG